MKNIEALYCSAIREYRLDRLRKRAWNIFHRRHDITSNKRAMMIAAAHQLSLANLLWFTAEIQRGRHDNAVRESVETPIRSSKPQFRTKGE